MMDKYLFTLIVCCIFANTRGRTSDTPDTKTLELTGSIIAPWVKGQLCAHYKHAHKDLEQCFTIKAGQTYKIEQIPAQVKRVTVTRSFYKQCPADKREKNRCKTLKGSFFLTEPETILNLTYDNWRILKDYTMPPAPPMSNFGYPDYGSSTRLQNYRSNPDGLAV